MGTVSLLVCLLQILRRGQNELLQILLLKGLLTDLQVNRHLDMLPVNAVVLFELLHRQVPQSLQLLPLDVIQLTPDLPMNIISSLTPSFVQCAAGAAQMMSKSYLVVDEVQLVSDAAVPNLLDIDRFELFAKVCVTLEHL